MKINRTHLALAGFSILVTACGGGGSNGGGTDTVPTQSFGLLKQASSDQEMNQNLKKGLAGGGAINGIGAPVSLEDALTGAPDVDADFSTTNLQEEGVDEADITKYDGEVLYVLDRSWDQNVEPALTEDAGIALPTGSIRLFRTDPDAVSIEQVSRIETDSDLGSISGLYLAQPNDQKLLISIGQTFPVVPWAVFALDYFWQEGKTKISTWDVSDAQSPTKSWTLELDGSLLSSRRIDDILYVVTRYTPTIEGVNPFPVTEEEIAANQEVIDAIALSDLLPNISRDGGEPQELLQASNCYLPNPEYQGLTLPPSSGSLISVTAIDLTAPDSIQSICLNTFASGFYASRESLYITASGSNDSTLIHKISLQDGKPGYSGSGEVIGYIGTANPSYLMSENGKELRVMSSSWANRIFPFPVMDADLAADPAPAAETEDFGVHRLTILRESEDGTRLDTIAELPNSARPEHIGKPGEDIYAARFLGDRAYAVTFEVIDPLYVLDISDSEDPKVSGSLELPGFSTLLQPLGSELLLGVGSQVPEDGSAAIQGVKIALFNVGDIAAPIELESIVIGKRGTGSPTTYDYHALTLLETDGIYRAAIPIQRHQTIVNMGDDINNPFYWYNWTDSGLYQFEINPGTGSLAQVGTLITEQRSDNQSFPTYEIGTGRSVIHGDAVFFTLQSKAWAQEWGF